MSAGEIVSKWVAPALGLVIATGMFAAPMPAVLKARREGSLKSLNPLPWVCITANCIGWVGYGLLKRDYWVFSSNEPGFVMGMFYTLTAIQLAPQKAKAIMLNALLGLSVLMPMAAFFICMVVRNSWTQERKEFFWGVMCNVVLVVYYTAPLSTMALVIKTKDSQSLYWPTCVMNMLNGVCWASYGGAIRDPFIFFPNSLGILLSLSQLVLVFVYPSRARRPSENGLGAIGAMGVTGGEGEERLEVGLGSEVEGAESPMEAMESLRRANSKDALLPVLGEGVAHRRGGSA